MALPPTLTVIRSSVVALVVAVAVSAGTLVASTGGSVSARSIATASFQGVTSSRQPDIVLILTDDQRFDTLWAMPTVRSELVAKGVSFSNGYVSNPVCCPSRSSTLTGQYSHTTRVYTNHPKEPFGGFPAFDDRSTVATWLQQAGYRTALMGKYLNGYARFVRSAGLGPMVRDLGRRCVLRLFGQRRRRDPELRRRPRRLRDRRAGRSGHRPDPVDGSGPTALPVLRAACGPRPRHAGPARPGGVREPRTVEAGQLRRGGCERQARVHPGARRPAGRGPSVDRGVPSRPVPGAPLRRPSGLRHPGRA